MITAAFIIVMAVLLLIIWQDIKKREIHILLPVLLFICTAKLAWSPNRGFYYLLQNIVFFVIVFGILILYMSIKHKSFLNPFQHYFGAGDLLFFISVTPLFLLRPYIIFFIASLLFSILCHTFFKSRMRLEVIPLAGYASVFLCLVLANDLFAVSGRLTLIPPCLQ